jgi:hypothetical protein
MIAKFIKVTTNSGNKMIIKTNLIETVVDRDSARSAYGVDSDDISAAIAVIKNGREIPIYTQDTIDEIYNMLKEQL